MVILVVVVGLIMVALVSIAARGGATTAAAPTPTTPNGVRAQRDITWRHVDGANLTLDAFLPARATSGRPAVLLIHGGGWRAGEKASLDPEAERLAALGYDAFPVDSRLAPADPYPAAVDDVQAAVQWLRDPTQAQRFGLDPHRIGALGSFGRRAPRRHARHPRARAARPRGPDPRRGELVGAMDFVDVPVAALTAQQQAAVHNDIGSFLGCLPAACPTTAKAASPVTQVDATDALMLLVNSDAELVPVDQAQRMAAALQAAGVREQLVVLHGHLHAAAYGAQVWDQTVAFLGHDLGSPKP